MIRPALKNTVHALSTGDAVWLLCGPDDDDLVVDEHVELVGDLLRRLDGRRTIDELAAEMAAAGGHQPVDVRTAVEELAATGILYDAAPLDALPTTVVERAERHLSVLAHDAQREPADAQWLLHQSRVCLLGLGGFGSWVALGLASAGVGAMVGVDGDSVERSNLNRQVLYGESDVGERKTVAARRAIHHLNPELRFDVHDRRIDGPDAVAQVIEGCDLVVDSLDEPAHLANRWVSEACFREGIPFMTISQQPPLIRVGPLYVPGRTGCYSCVEAAQRRRHPFLERLESAEILARQRATSGPASAAGAALAVHDIVRFLVRGDAGTVGAAHTIDLRTLVPSVDLVEPVPGCAVCGG